MKLTEPNDREVTDCISREIAAIHEESYGEPVREVETTLMADSVICLVEIDLLPFERTLLKHDPDGDSATSIRNTRRSFQEAIKPAFIASVERATGRRVTAFLCETNLDPPFSLEYFRLDGLARSER